MRLPALAIRNHRFTQVIVALVAALGFLSFFTMPRTEDPVFELPMANVVVVFPGADPEIIEALAVDPLEEAIDELDDLRTLETSIEDGVAVLSVEMMSGTSADDAYDAVLQKVNEVRDELPAEVRSVDVIQPSLSDVTVLQLALVEAGSAPAADGGAPAEVDRVGGVSDMGGIRRAAEALEREIEGVSGVKAVDTWGYADPQVRIHLDPERMRALALSVDHVAAAVRWAGADVPGGFVVAGDRRLNVRTSGDFDTLADIERAVIPGVPGRLLRVGDVAEVRWATEDEEHRARYQGRAAVFLSVIQREGTNIFAVLDGVEPVVENFRGRMPAGLEIHTVFDQSESVRTRVNGFFSSLLQGIALVGVVMFFFVGFRAAILVMVTIPLAITFALAGVDLAGYGLQQMSIVGLVIALGLLVDDAIVVVENIGRLVREGRSVMDAAVEGASEVAWPSATGTLTTVLAFVPMVAIQSGTGDYIRSLPVTVILALVASLGLSLTLTPLMARRALARGGRGRSASETEAYPGGTGLLQAPLTNAAGGPYRRLLASALARPRRVLLAGTGALAVSFALFPLVGVSLFPKAEKAQILVNVEAPNGTDLAAVDGMVADIEEVLAGRGDVVRYAANAGGDNPQVYYNVQPRQTRANIGQILVELESYEAAQRAIPELNRVFDGYPGARISITEFENGPPVEAPIVLKVTGPELATLESLAARIEDLLLAHPDARDVRNPLGVRRTDLEVAVDPDRLALLGLDPLTVDRTVRAGVAGLEVGRLRDAEGQESDIVMRFPFMGHAPSPADLNWVTLLAPSGGSVPLSQVATVEFTPGSGRIDHYDTRRVATVTAYPVGDASPLEVTRDVTAELESMDFPPGYEWFAGGTFEEQQEGFGGMIRALMVAVLGIFAVLVLQFRSFLQPLIIFASVPLAFVGAVLALLVTGHSFSFTAFIGITSLVGIVINNSIILVDYTNRRVAEGDSVDEALRRAGEVRFQPIVLTTLTTVCGLLPLTLTGSSLWSPLGWTIIGGLLTSTFLTLVVVPVLYRLVATVGPLTPSTVGG